MPPPRDVSGYFKLAAVALGSVLAAYSIAFFIRSATGWGSVTGSVILFAFVLAAVGVLLPGRRGLLSAVLTSLGVVVATSCAEFIGVLFAGLMLLVVPPEPYFWLMFAVAYLPIFLSLVWVLHRARTRGGPNLGAS